MEQKQLYPDGRDCRATDGVTVFTNFGKKSRTLESGEWGFRHAALLIFDGTGFLCEAGGYLLPNTEEKAGSIQDRITLPENGFAVAFGDNADAWLFQCFREVMGDAVWYNSTLVPDRPCYGSYDPESNCLQLTLPDLPEGDGAAFRILFLGNSIFYHNGCPLKFRALCRTAGIPVQIRYCTFGGAFLHQYADPETEHGRKLRSLLDSESYDYVLIQDATGATLQQSAEAMRVLLPLIEKNGARPVFMNRNCPYADPEKYREEAPKMDRHYRDLSQLFRIPASPVGNAFTICRARYSEIDLYDGDRFHNSAEGSYLLACTLMGTLFGEPAEGSPYHAFLDAETARKLQECADEANRRVSDDPVFWFATAAQDLKAGSLTETQEFALLAAEEGSVLLKNDGTLPLRPGTAVALFGRMQTEYIKSGTGSGGKVHAPFVPSIRECLLSEDLRLDGEVMAEYDAWIAEHPIDRGDGWVCPWNQEEMPLSEKTVAAAAERNDVALYIVGRTAGEGKDCTAQPGSYFLTETEKQNLRLLHANFRHVAVLLNIGNQMDLAWLEEIPVSSVLCLWQGGMMGAPACAALLTGRVNPSGRLADTIARNIEDYPSDGHFGNPEKNVYTEDIYVGYRYFETFAKDRVLFPFGYGLSYTSFEIVPDVCSFDGKIAVATAWVTNTGDVAGKQVVQWYVSAPQNGIGTPSRRLIGFAKTGLLAPGESEQVRMQAGAFDLASYDDVRCRWILEEGEYAFWIGPNVRDAEEAYRFVLPENVLKNCLQLLAPESPFFRMTLSGLEETPARREKPVPPVPPCLPFTGDRGIRLPDVADGNASMEEFLAQLTETQLMCMVRGEGMNSPKVTAGSAGAFAGVTDELLGFGIPILCAADGPSGVRLAGDVTTEVQKDGTTERKGSIATALPNGTLLACTWNTELVRTLYFYEGIEIRLYNIDTILGPGINIHRHPLCGRNFEYFSECPVLTGKITAAAVRGLDDAGIAATVKHFFGNSQEINRVQCNSIMSERAAREIYTKAFEIAVREGGCRSVMTSYNPVNGYWSASNPDLTAYLLRGEWGFDGVVMTDWWADVNADEPGKSDHESLHRMVIAQNDVHMLSPDAATRRDRLEEAFRKGELTRDQLVECATHICRFAIRTPAFLRMRSGERPLEQQNVSAEGMTEYAALESPEAGAEYRFAGPTGQCVAAFEAEALDTGDKMAQKMLVLRVDGARAAVLTLSPSEGSQTVLRAFTVISGTRSYLFEYDPREIRVNRVRFLAENE